MARNDRVDELRAEWARARPDIDTSPVAVVARIGRAARFLDNGMDDYFGHHGISRPSWDILATLRRSGPPFRLSPTDLYRAVMRTSGAMTRRIDTLERAGWVTRTPDPADRRGIMVALTLEGLALVDALAEGHVENERKLLAPLSEDEQRILADLLKKLL
ncbi:MAG: MarR family transcriptional regulator, partial [Chloroflexota bacterium]|nr:MarR family transcriptional regulator [Chloroflexota bacterium]